MDDSKKDISLSVVIIGHNEGERLNRCFESVVKMAYPSNQTEYIYVDSNSSDTSVSIAESYQARVITITDRKPTAALARNLGWKVAKGDFVLFLDGDTLIQPHFVSDSMHYFKDPAIAVVCGQRREMYPEKSFYQSVMDLDWIYPEGFDLFCGGDAIIRRSALVDVGGYDSSLIGGEEPEMCRRLRLKQYRIIFQNKLMTLHDLDMTTFEQYWNRAVRTGHAYAEMASKYGQTSMPLWLDESRRNMLKIFILTLSLLIGFFLLITQHTITPFIFIFLMIFMLIIRTAYKNKNKTESPLLRLLYGFHSHFVHLPIFVGQLKYWKKKVKNK